MGAWFNIRTFLFGPPSWLRPPTFEVEGNDVVVLTISGRLNDKAEEGLRSAFEELNRAGVRCLIVNASHASFQGNLIAGELISHLVDLWNHSIRILIVVEPGCERNTDWWLRMTKLDQILETFPSTKVALAAARGGDPGQQESPEDGDRAPG